TNTPDGAQITLRWNGSSETILFEGVSASALNASKFIFNTSTAALNVTGTTYGSDVLFGGSGKDTLSGLGGNDELNGGRGKDTLIGGVGNDILRGGADDDTFSYRERGFGDDVIKDFSGGDRISLSFLNVGDFDTLKPYITNTPDGAQITLRWNGSSETILLEGVSASALNASKFIFDGSTAARSFTGTTYGSDVLFGGRGDDTLNGLGGNDEL
ncbi:hypothetical protein ACFQ4O_18125, partial [Methylopila musalis]